MSFSRSMAPFSPVRITMLSNWDASSSRPLEVSVNSNCWPLPVGGAPAEPAETSMFWLSIASMTSAGVTPRTRIFSGRAIRACCIRGAERAYTAYAFDTRKFVDYVELGIVGEIQTVVHTGFVLFRATNRMMSDERDSTLTPCCFTEAGSTGSACDTRFCTFTVAMSRSVPFSNVISREYEPSEPDEEAHIHHSFDAVYLLFDRGAYCFGHSLRVGSGIVCRDEYCGRVMSDTVPQVEI